ncbi:MAG: AraC family transcriptional regulator [Candidatus Aminicenantes bacterium]|nr:AraC family transcriptional regulator [Candidatus Aminicenantes bacterium]
MNLGIYEILCFIAVFQLFLLSFFLVTFKKGKRLSNHLLAVFLFTKCLGVNFFDFVNKYRVEEAKKLFLDVSNNSRSILEQLFDAGFNSKSVFNRVFKKYTGMTPSEFKRIHQG